MKWFLISALAVGTVVHLPWSLIPAGVSVILCWLMARLKEKHEDP